MINIVVAGASGRMGNLICELVDEAPNLNLAGRADIDKPLDNTIHKADVVIDFTEAGAAAKHAELASQNNKPIVIGTTGLNDEQRAKVKTASLRVPVIHAPNMSLGVNVLFHLIRSAAKALDQDFRIDIEETHHTKKLDRPSGTAKRMEEIVAAEGHHADVKSFREGDVVGDHSVRFDSPEEILEIKHSAKTRKLFARGAVVAARWIVGKPAGLYDMSDVLGLK